MGKKLLSIVILLMIIVASVRLLDHSTDRQQIKDSPSHTALLEEKPNPNFDYISASTEPIKEKEKKSIEDVVGNMSLEEKVGQMIIAGLTGTTFNETIASLLAEQKVGGLIFYEDNLKTPKQTVDLLNQVKKANLDNPIPLLLTIDQEGGQISKLPGDLNKLPINKAIGRINDPNFSYQIGELLGEQVKAFGFNLDYAPVLDVNSNPDNPIIGKRSFGDNPDVVSKLGIQTMKGIQSENIISVIKHFPGHGDTAADSHVELPTVNKSKQQLHELEFIPFKRAINNGADAMMVAHILLPKIDPVYPATMSPTIINDILRKQLGFSGVVITDDMTMNAITNNYDIQQAAVKAVQAGNDMIMVAHGYQKVVKVVEALTEAVQQGQIREAIIDDSVQRIVQLKTKYELDRGKIEEANITELNKAIEKVVQ